MLDQISMKFWSSQLMLYLAQIRPYTTIPNPKKFNVDTSFEKVVSNIGINFWNFKKYNQICFDQHELYTLHRCQWVNID